MDFQSIALPTELPDRIYLLRLSINSTNNHGSRKSYALKVHRPNRDGEFSRFKEYLSIGVLRNLQKFPFFGSGDANSQF